MTLDQPRAAPNHAAMDDMAEFACPAPDMSMCAPEFLSPPEPPSRRRQRLQNAGLVLCVLALMALGALLDA